MPVTSVAAVRNALGLDSSADATLAPIWAAVEDALVRLCRPYCFTPTTFTDVILDAPPTESLILPAVPVRSIASLYLRYGAGGDPTAFTADDLLTQYTDYQLVIDQPADGLSRSGLVRRLWDAWGGGTWGGGRRRPLGRLASEVIPSRGAVKVTFAAGPLDTPAAAVEAVTLAVAMLYNRRQEGMPLASESWNGRSVAYAGPFTAAGVLSTPDCAMLLAPFQNYGC